MKKLAILIALAAVLGGKRVVGSKREIGEVQGAHDAYAAADKFTPTSRKDLLKAHGLMTKGLVEKPGTFRKCGVVVATSSGNGRMGRLWQTLILGKWNPLFYAVPVENMVYNHQREYYRALHSSQVSGDATRFIDFMLGMILRTLKEKRSTIIEAIAKLKASGRLLRIGPDNGGHWQISA